MMKNVPLPTYAWLPVAALALLTSCTVLIEEETGQVTEAVLNGSPTTIESTVLVYSGSLCGGAVVGPRHVATLSLCIQEPQTIVIQQPPQDGVANVVETIEGTAVDVGGTELTPVVLVTAEDLTLPAAPVETTLPAMDDVVRLVGYGTANNDVGSTATEGDMLVAELGDGWFRADGQNGVEGCRGGDMVGFDPNDAIVGISGYGGLGPGSCLSPLFFLGAAAWQPLLDGVGGAGGGTGAGGSSQGGAGGSSTSSGAPATTESDDDSGCSCRAAGAPIGAHWSLALLGLGWAMLIARRRR